MHNHSAEESVTVLLQFRDTPEMQRRHFDCPPCPPTHITYFFVFEPQVSLLWAGECHRRCCLLCLLKTRSSRQVKGRGLFIRGRARTDTAGGFTRVATMRCTPFHDTDICRVDLCGLLLANGVQDTQRRSLTRAADENRASPGDVVHALSRA